MPATIENAFLNITGRKTQLVHGGNGPPLLYLHSAGGETEWMPFFEQLAEKWHVYIPAHPGFSLSEGLETIDDMQDLVWHTLDLMDELKLERVPVVGFSLGAWLGAELAIHRPERVSKLAMIAAAGLYVPGAPMAELFIDDLDELTELLFYDTQSPGVALGMPSSMEDSRILLWIRAREATARIAWNPYLHNPRLRQHLHRIQCPTRLIWGRQDKLIPLAHGECYEKEIPGAKLEVIEECGHMVPFEKGEELIARLNLFLSGK